VTALFWPVVGVLALWGGIVAVRKKRESPRLPAAEAAGPDDIDRATLEAAEREVMDMENDAKGRPLDEGVGDDWGPGTPKPPYV
jgi:hypothetical protein